MMPRELVVHFHRVHELRLDFPRRPHGEPVELVTEALRLGDSSVNWHGRIDQVAIWSRAMTIGEIQALYASGAGKANVPAGRPQ